MAKTAKEIVIAKIGLWQAVLVALVTGTIGFATAIVSRHVSQADYQPIGDRASVLRGIWTGTYDQPDGPEGIPVVGAPLHLDFRPSKKLVTGTGLLTLNRKDGSVFQLPINFRGGFLHDQFLRLEYECSDDRAIQFGSMVAMLSPDGRTLSGGYVGFGAMTGHIVHGTATAHR